MSAISGTALNKARVRHFRFQGLELWKVSLIIDLLPILLHLALGVFLAGVIIFLFPLDPRIAWVIVVIAGITYALYFISVILPIRYPDCPYTSSLTIYAGNVYYFLSAIFRGFGLMAKDKFRQRILDCRVSYRKKISYWKVIFQERIPFPVWRPPRYLFNPFNRTLRKLITWLSRTHQHLRGYISTNGFINWREDNINEAIKEGVVSLDCKALYWLCAISSNPSVRRIIAQGISVHPAPAQEATLILLQLFWASNVDETNLNDLFYGLCLDLQSGLIYHWDRLQKLSDEDSRQLDEMENQSYCRIVKSICNGDYIQVLKDASNDDTLKFPLAIWHRVFEKASKDATLVAHILTYAELDPFNWDSDPSRIPTNNTGIVSFGTPEQRKWIFDYLFRCFYKGVEPDYSSEIRSVETHYLLVVSVYRNLTSEQTIIADERQRQESLEQLFRKFHWSLSSGNRDISPKHYLAFHRDILSVDAFWNESMTHYARWNAILCLSKIWSLMDADVASRFLFTECPDLTPIIRWCSQDRVDVSAPIVSLLFMPQSRASLLTILSNDPDARSNFSKCLKNIRRCKYERIKGDYVYPSLMTLFMSADPTMPWFVNDDSILVQAWILLVLHFDAKEFLMVIQSKLNQLRLENLFVVMLKEVKFEEEETIYRSNDTSDAFSFRQAHLTYLDRLHASLGEFRRIIGTAWPKLESTAGNSTFVSGSAGRRDDDTEACRREFELDENEVIS